MQFEDGFHFHALPSLSGEAKSLIVILHGHASHPDKYLGWAEKTRQASPGADLLLVRAPVALKATENQKLARSLHGVDDLYTWYRLDENPLAQAGLLLRQAFRGLGVVERLNRLIDGQLRKRNLRDKDLAFIGFSMGGALAVQSALRRRGACAAVVCHSGAVLPFTRVRGRPDTLMIVGDRDELFFLNDKKPPRKSSRFLSAFKKAGLRNNLHHARSVRRLAKAGIEVTEKVLKDLDHRITEDSWREACSFVAQRLRPKP